jgi:hypothetical protein
VLYIWDPALQQACSRREQQFQQWPPYWPFYHYTYTLSAGVTGKFYMDSDGHYSWEPDGCRLRRFTGDEARKCLSGRHVAFVGDSVTRYQYISLAFFLSKKVCGQTGRQSDRQADRQTARQTD